MFKSSIFFTAQLEKEVPEVVAVIQHFAVHSAKYFMAGTHAFGVRK